MNAIVRLEELLNQKDAEIERLKEELQEASERLELDMEWFVHEYKDEDPRPSLPVPRLEIEATQDDGENWHNFTWRYCLVYRHLLGHLIFVPLGNTTSSGGNNQPPIHAGVISTPFRDGAHIRKDSFHLNLPAYAIVGNTIEKLEPYP